ncbi:MAG: ketoacyl-ACP synthase III [Lachnospiraceae bacterium]|nr:ketoacyl-ACP synthase III [Lachnospiraceae bacterium]
MTGRICGTGSCLPKEVWDNDRLSQMVDTSDEWIRERTGIRQRHIATGEETTVSLAVGAARAALEDAGISAEEIDLLMVATVSPDEFFPTTSCRVQDAIGAVNATCFDLNAACTGFIFALNTAQAYISQGIYRTALIIGAERLSNLTNWEDRTTCILFGDGAGAAVVRAQDEAADASADAACGSNSKSAFDGENARERSDGVAGERNGNSTCGMDGTRVGNSICGVDGTRGGNSTCGMAGANVSPGRYAQVTHSVGAKGDALTCVSRNQAKYAGVDAPETYLQMDGRAVFKFAVSKVPAVILELAEKEKIDLAEVKYFVLHQANERIIQGIRKKLKPEILHLAEGHLREEHLREKDRPENQTEQEDEKKPDVSVNKAQAQENVREEKTPESEEEYEARFPVNIHDTGNTSSASIPILLDQLNKEGKLQRGDKLILAGFGAGLSYGASYMVW